MGSLGVFGRRLEKAEIMRMHEETADMRKRATSSFSTASARQKVGSTAEPINRETPTEPNSAVASLVIRHLRRKSWLNDAVKALAWAFSGHLKQFRTIEVRQRSKPGAGSTRAAPGALHEFLCVITRLSIRD